LAEPDADDRAALRPAPDDFEAACPELELLVLESPDRVRPLVFDGFSGCPFDANGGWAGWVCAADWAAPTLVAGC